MSRAVRKTPSLRGAGAQIEILARAMFFWAWGDKWHTAKNGERDDYRKEARAFLRTLRTKRR